MARKCAITGKGVQAGNNVSHANNRTRRRFLPNVQSTTLFSPSLNQSVRLKVSTHGLRTIEHNGGLDAYIQKTAITKLPKELRNLKKQLAAKQA